MLHSKAVFLFTLFLAGCASVPDSDLAQPMTQVNLTPSTDKALSRDFFDEGGWPSERWWEMFGDKKLSALIERAFEESPSLQRAIAQKNAAEEAAKKERAALFPSLSADFLEQWQYFSKNGFERSFFPTMPGMPIPATVNQLDLTLNFNYEIDFFGRNRNRFFAALGMARAQAIEVDQAKLLLSSLIAQTYFELQAKQAQRKIIRLELDTRISFLELNRERRENALEMEIPVLDALQQVYAMEQGLITIEKEVALDIHLINLLIGTSPGERIVPDSLKGSFDGIFPLPKTLSTDLLARRPDLMAQIWRVEAEAKMIGAAKADFYPRVNLYAFAGLESLAFSKLFKISSKMGGLEPAIHLPIFTGGWLRANLKEKVADFNQAVFDYNELLLHAAKEVADNLVTFQTTFDNLNRQILSTDAVEKQLKLEKQRYKKGVSSLLSVLKKQEAYLQQRYLLIGYKRDHWLSIVKLIKSLGGGYQWESEMPQGCL